MIFEWGEMDYWNTGEWQAVEEKLADLHVAKKKYNPGRRNLFAALRRTQFEDTKVAVLGQDPYPKYQHATGVAFSIPEEEEEIPVTLANIFREYCNDLHYPYPKNGSLVKWTEEGVLLWNVIPSCETGKSLSHLSWDEWRPLTEEIIKRLNMKGIVFAFLGGIAREFSKFVDSSKNFSIETSHPSPRGNLHGKIPFLGSRLFTTINCHLETLGRSPIDWKL